MSSTKTDHYFRLLTLLFEGPTKTLLEYVLVKAGCTFYTLDTYINQPTCQSFLQNNLPRYQYDRLFRPGIQLEKKIFDISLSYNLLTKLFQLTNQEDQWITDIKNIRDDLSHRCDSFEIIETDFVNKWRDIMDATKGLAGQISHSYLQEMTDTIEDVKQRTLPPPGPYVDILKDWLGTMNGTVNALNGTINELRDDMKTLKESSKITTSIFEETVYVGKRKGGDAYMMANASTSRIGQRKSLLNATFEHKTTFSATTKDGLIVQACTIMPSGHCIIAYKQSVVLVDINFKLMSEEDVSDISGIATVDDRNVIITRRDQYPQYIHVNLSVSPPSLTLGYRIDVGENVRCTGIDVNDIDIYVLCFNGACGKPEILVLNKGSGVKHNTISLDAFWLTYYFEGGIKVSPNGDRVYVSSGTSVVCISTRGDNVYTYSGLHRTSIGMYVDNEDNLLVCTLFSNNIHLIDKDGMDVKDVSDGLHNPRCLCYREIDSCLVLVCRDIDMLTIKVKW